MRRWPRWFSRRFLRLALVLVVAVVIAACTTRIETIREIEVTRIVEVGAAATPLPPAEPRLLTVLVGAGADTVAVNAFLPSSVTIRAGDTIMWELNHLEEFHTTVFLSGAKTPPVFVPVPGGGPRELQVNQKLAFPPVVLPSRRKFTTAPAFTPRASCTISRPGLREYPPTMTSGSPSASPVRTNIFACFILR